MSRTHGTKILSPGVEPLSRSRTLDDVVLGLRQRARFGELEDRRKLPGIEPKTVGRAHVDDDPELSRKFLLNIISPHTGHLR